MPQRGGAPFADAVQREDGGLVERAGEEGAGGMAFVMIQEDERRRRLRPRPWRIGARRNSFSLSQTGMARRKLRKPRGAKAR